ncbi:dephospho-CoA kinase [Kitasatospora sp. SolWspMP-SS2h]|uniref:dephospho-CoA kinase n=1 Tax=Kitasatospora sp. SolWspMP-SS2h TaxID=1305729 RepID=UPI000DB91692|nr:dephospho-CoA kinase [Kitasatospora sp. SolWspMP-SS2h]RAJ43737.1 dephospho-CoA kinase [Kitasatospora sp. SolWspMP-SS2h]
MLRIGLTGGIGAGKSEVSRQLAAHGAVIVDSDVIAREVVAPGTPGLAAVAAEFGPGVLLPDGALDRPALGRIVFADPARLAKLNAIVHPLVRARSAELESAAGPDAIVVHDVPLLAENGLAPLYDLVVVIDVPDGERLRRLVELRGMAEDEARSRMAAQAGREERLAVADLVLDNGGDLEQLTARVEELWRRLEERRA